MKKMCVVLCLVLVASMSAMAQSSSVFGHQASGNAPLVFTKHVIKGMYNTSADLEATMVAGLNAIDGANTVSCPGTSGTCLIQADQWVQADVASGDGVAICLYVDGVPTNGCYWNGGSTGYPFAMYSVSQGIVVSHGNHTVQTYFFDAAGGAFVGLTNSNYYVYKP